MYKKFKLFYKYVMKNDYNIACSVDRLYEVACAELEGLTFLWISFFYVLNMK